MKHIQAIATLTFALAGCSYHVDKQAAIAPTGIAQANLSFAQVQTQILGPKCVRCHAWASQYERVHSRIAEIAERVQSTDPDFMMPKPGSAPLTAEEKAALLAWIHKGGPLSGEERPAPAPGQPLPAPSPEPSPVPSPSPSPAPAPAPTFTAVKIRVLDPKCLRCHKRDFDTFEHTRPLIREIAFRIHAIGQEEQMPPPRATQLTTEELGLLDDWIRAGAPEK